jgi:protein translocase SecG subunit
VTTLTLVLFILLLPLCLFLIGLILLQGGAGDISSAFGGGGQLDSTLGVGAGRKMSKITGWLSGTFMAIVLLLSIQHAGDFGTAAGPGTKPAALPVGNDGQGAPATPPGAPAPATDAAPQPSAPAPAPAPAPTPAVEQPAAPAAAPAAPTAPAPGAGKPAEQPAAPAAVQPVPAVPQQPAPAGQPTAPAAQPAPVPAAPVVPRSGITLDEPAK